MMKITHSLSVDLQHSGSQNTIYAKQGDRLTREVTINLFNGGSVWAAPSEVAVVQLAYCKSDKVGGCYDHMPDEHVAGTFNQDRTAVTMQLHPQVLNVAGNVFCELRLLTNAGEILNTFNFIVNVQKSPIAMTLASEGYYNNVFDGATFIPHISPDGTVSWTNNKNLPNPASVNVKGPKGDDGKSAYEFAVAGGYTGTPEQFAAEAAGIASSVKYTAQNHTEEEKMQARENIDAFSKNGGEIFGDVTASGCVSAQREVIVNENVTINSDGVYCSNGTLNIDSADDIDLTAWKVHVHAEELDADSVVTKKYVDDAVDEIPDWAKQPNKPGYQANEIDYHTTFIGEQVGTVDEALAVVERKINDNGKVNTVEHNEPDEDNNVNLESVVTRTRFAQGAVFTAEGDSFDSSIEFVGPERLGQRTVRVTVASDGGLILETPDDEESEDNPDMLVNLRNIRDPRYENDAANKKYVDNKQNKLTSGDRISIDSNNVISADEQVFVAKYGKTTYSEIFAAYIAGKSVICNYSFIQMRLYRVILEMCVFVADYVDEDGDYQYSVVVSSDNTWGDAHMFDRRQPLIDYVDNIVGNIETAINEIRGVTAE